MNAMTRAEIIEKLRELIEPYVQDQESFADLGEKTHLLEDLKVNSANLVGVMWGQEDRFALVENGKGFGYILRVGDRVQNGRVVSIRKNSLTARVTLYGITNQVILKLEKTEG